MPPPVCVHDLLQLFVPIKEQEVQPVLYSFSALFTILTSYFLLLPLREDAGISLGTSTLPKLFACSLLVTLVVTPAVTAYINSKGHAQGRDAALRHFYRAMALILLGFFVLYNFSMVEGFVDKYGLSQLGQQQQQRLHHPMHASQQAHPLDTVLHHRQQQQQQGEGGAADSQGTPLASTRHLAAAGQQQHPQLHPQQQQRRQLLQVEQRPDSTADRAGSTAAAGSAVSAASSSGSSSSDGSSSGGAGDGRSGDPTLTRPQRRLRATFYVWVNVMNLVGISSLWAKTADAFSPDAGARLFGFISAGATLGQLAGSLIAMTASWVAGLMLSQVQANLGGVAVGSSSGGSDSKSAAESGSSSSGRAAPASSLLLVAAMLQLAAAQLVTRIRPVVTPAAATAAGAAAAVVPDSSSSGSGGDRAASPQLVRRSWSGGPAAVVAPHSSGFSQRLAKQPSQLSAGQGQSGAAAAGLGAAASAATPGSNSAAAVSIHSSGAATAAAAASKHQPGSQLGGLGGGSQGLAASANGGGSSHSSSTGAAAAPLLNGGSSSGQKAGKGSAGFQMGKVLTGFQLIWRSRYLLLVCSNLLLTYVVGSLTYFQRALVVSAAAAVHGPTFRTSFFAALNTYSAAAILVMQLFATSSLLRWMGMSAALGLAPLICMAGLLSVAACPLPWMVAVTEVLRKIFGYAVLRPAREVLFTVVSREEKYSAKLVIDTVIQRLGDALAAAVFQVLDVQWSLGQAGVGAAGGCMCVVWLFTALALGRKHKQLASSALKT